MGSQGQQQFRPQGGNPQSAPWQQQRNGSQQHLQNRGQQQFQGRQQLAQQQFSPEQQQKRQAILKRFDRDGDGQLSDQEKTHLKKALGNRKKAQRQQPQGPVETE